MDHDAPELSRACRVLVVPFSCRVLHPMSQGGPLQELGRNSAPPQVLQVRAKWTKHHCCHRNCCRSRWSRFHPSFPCRMCRRSRFASRIRLASPATPILTAILTPDPPWDPPPVEPPLPELPPLLLPELRDPPSLPCCSQPASNAAAAIIEKTFFIR